MGKFHSAHGLVERGLVVQLESGALRSACAGTIDERIEELKGSAASALAAIKAGAPRWTTDFNGDAHDVSKQYALMQVSKSIKILGSMSYGDAAKLYLKASQMAYALADATNEPGTKKMVNQKAKDEYSHFAQERDDLQVRRSRGRPLRLRDG